MFRWALNVERSTIESRHLPLLPVDFRLLVDGNPSTLTKEPALKEPIISVSGLRGIIGESLSPELAMRFSSAFAAGLPAGPIVLTYDGRNSGPMLSLAIQAGLSAIGRNVIVGDIAATPTTGVLVRQHEAVGAIQISASHNPSAYNGLKLFSDKGQVLSADQGEQVLERYRSGETAWIGYDELGASEPCGDTTAQHLELVLNIVDAQRINGAKFHVLLDSNHGSGSLLGRRLLGRLGCEVTFLGGKPNGAFAHPPEPTAENLAEVGGRVKSCGADVGFCQDPDADRLALIDENGRYVGEEYTLAICLDHVLRSRAGTVVTNCATSRMAEDVANKYSCPFVRTAVGEANVVEGMQSKKAVFGGEGNGGPIDPRVGFVRDSFVGMALVLNAMADRGKKLSELADELPRYEIVKSKVEVDRARIEEAFDKLASHFTDASANRMDGLRLDWTDKWLLIRPSNTEPIVRVIAEAPTREAAVALCEEVAQLI